MPRFDGTGRDSNLPLAGPPAGDWPLTRQTAVEHGAEGPLPLQDVLAEQTGKRPLRGYLPPEKTPVTASTTLWSWASLVRRQRLARSTLNSKFGGQSHVPAAAVPRSVPGPGIRAAVRRRESPAQPQSSPAQPSVPCRGVALQSSDKQPMHGYTADGCRLRQRHSHGVGKGGLWLAAAAPFRVKTACPRTAIARLVHSTFRFPDRA